MKTIFVTIDEFIHNGGIIEPGRTIYRAERRHFSSNEFPKNELLENSLQLGTFVEKDNTSGVYIMKNELFQRYPLTGEDGYIKINAQPLYQ